MKPLNIAPKLNFGKSVQTLKAQSTQDKSLGLLAVNPTSVDSNPLTNIPQSINGFGVDNSVNNSISSVDVLNPQDALQLGGPGSGITGNVLVVYQVNGDYGNADISITSLLGGNKWGGGLGVGANLTYSFSTSSSTYNYPFVYKSTIREFSADQKQAARSILSHFSTVANLTFSEVADTPISAGDLRFANSDSPSASAFLPSGGPAGGDMQFGGSGVSPLTNIYDYFAMMHEIGHSLGLIHTHDGVVAGTVYDQVKYTVMSYRQYPAAVGYYSDNYFPTTLMLDDVQALQFLYGANKNYRTGSDTYSWAAGTKVFETIVDSGGVDTISAATQSQAAKINLNSGQWSEMGIALDRGDSTMVRDNLTIAYGTVIENATGSSFNDTLIGNSASNVLNGALGSDYMAGGAGSDTYYVNTLSDVVIENLNAGVDKVYSYINYTLGANIEGARALGTKGLVLSGNELNNILYSGVGNDTLNGGSGSDTVDYTFSNAAIIVNLSSNIASGFGVDILSSIENVTGSSYNDTLYGNDYSNKLTGQNGNDVMYGYLGLDSLYGGAGDDYLDGGDGNDYLDGGAGVDTMNGGVGDDTYLLDNSLDVINEGASQGTDLVKSTVNYVMSANIENAQAIGSTNISITGNSLSNKFYAGAGNDTFNGGAGADMVYYSYATQGVSINLGTNSATGFGQDTFNSVESAFASTFNDVIFGSMSANNLYGSAGNDVINSLNGNDYLVGGIGNDTLDGGLGSDRYGFSHGDGNDVITDSDSTVGNVDSLLFLTGINFDQLWFVHSGLDLVVQVIGLSESVAIKNWYSSTGTNSTNHIEKIVAGGKTLLDTNVDNLVNAMSAFTVPSSGQTTLPANYQTALNPVIAANWS